MIDIIQLIIFGLILICILAIIGFVMRWIWKKGAIGKVSIAIFTLWLAWNGYQGIYPTESYYVKEFKRLVSIEIPSDAQFISKEASYPDFFGDYSACFKVQLTPTSFESFTKQLGVEIDQPQFEQHIIECINKDISIISNNPMHYFDLTPIAKRSDALIGVVADPTKKQIIVTWSLW